MEEYVDGKLDFRGWKYALYFGLLSLQKQKAWWIGNTFNWCCVTAALDWSHDYTSDRYHFIAAA